MKLNPAVVPYLSRHMCMEPTALADMERRLLAIDPSANLQALYGDDEHGDRPKPRKPYEMAGGVAVIRLSGPLQREPDWLMRYFGGTSTRVFIAMLNMAAGDPDVTSICLLVSSPGGDLDGTADAADAVYAVRTAGKKPIVASVEGYCCSAAYWIACQCSLMYAGQTDFLGSIGTRWKFYDTTGAYELMGIKVFEFTSGTYKAAGADGLPITEDVQAYYTGLVNESQARFSAGVARGRKLSVDAVRGIAADAKLYVGKSAQDAGLIDGIASSSDVIRTLQKQAGKSGTTAARSGTGAKMSLLEQIRTLVNGSGGDDNLDSTDTATLQARITTLTNEKAGLANQVVTLTGQNTTLTSQVQTLTTERDALQTRVTTFEAAEQSAATQALADAKTSAIATATTAFGPGTEQLAKAQAYIEAQTNVGAVASIEAAYKLAVPKQFNGQNGRQTQATETRTGDDQTADASFFAGVRAQGEQLAGTASK